MSDNGTPANTITGCSTEIPGLSRKDAKKVIESILGFPTIEKAVEALMGVPDALASRTKNSFLLAFNFATQPPEILESYTYYYPADPISLAKLIEPLGREKCFALMQSPFVVTNASGTYINVSALQQYAQGKSAIVTHSISDEGRRTLH